MGNVNTAENAKLMYEAGQDLTTFISLSDDGSGKVFTSGADLFSGRSGYDVNIKPNGLTTGGAVSVANSGSDDVVDVAALTCYLAGILTSVGVSTDFGITRGVGDGYIVCSITINSTGVLTEVQGAEGTSFSETRDENGGPPLIPVDSIEIAQVRLDSTNAALIPASEIKQVIGTHCERYDTPVWEVDYFNAQVEFVSALPTIHIGAAAKKVYAQYYEPDFAVISYSYDFVPPENSHSVNSTQVYGGTVGSRSTSLGQGAFTAMLKDGISDNLLTFKDEVLWFKFFPDRNSTPYLLCQGALGISRTFPAGDNIQASCTISAMEVAEGITT